MVFYRKYRSQTISELDLNSVRTKLTQLLSSHDIPHALLFTGPKGLGKTSSARILAKAINCQTRNGLEPCNSCEICTSITKGGSIDVIEIDAASNRGIDEMRALREKVKFAPSYLTKKVYIIDEVHMLTNEAFNALLKTLEEPPDHVLFILCTTESWKLPATITSRTFTVHFDKPNREELIGSLERVAKGEGLTIDDDVYDGIIDLADGAFRDAHKILEELSLSAPDKRITQNILESVFQSTTVHNHISSLLDALLVKNYSESLSVISTLAEAGVDFKQVTSQLVEHLRTQLLDSMNQSKSANLSLQELPQLIELLNDAYRAIPTSVLPQLPLEIAVIKWCVVSTEQQPITSPVSPAMPKRVVVPREETTQSITASEQPGQQVTTAVNMLYPLIDQIKKENQTVAALLRSCKVTLIDDKTLRITAPFKFHKDKLQESGNLKTITQAAALVFEKNIQVEVVIAN